MPPRPQWVPPPHEQVTPPAPMPDYCTQQSEIYVDAGATYSPIPHDTLEQAVAYAIKTTLLKRCEVAVIRRGIVVDRYINGESRQQRMLEL